MNVTILVVSGATDCLSAPAEGEECPRKCHHPWPGPLLPPDGGGPQSGQAPQLRRGDPIRQLLTEERGEEDSGLPRLHPRRRCGEGGSGDMDPVRRPVLPPGDLQPPQRHRQSSELDPRLQGRPVHADREDGEGPPAPWQRPEAVRHS